MPFIEEIKEPPKDYQMILKPKLPVVDESEEDMYQNWTIDKMISSVKDNDLEDDYY